MRPRVLPDWDPVVSVVSHTTTTLPSIAAPDQQWQQLYATLQSAAQVIGSRALAAAGVAPTVDVFQVACRSGCLRRTYTGNDANVGCKRRVQTSDAKSRNHQTSLDYFGIGLVSLPRWFHFVAVCAKISGHGWLHCNTCTSLTPRARAPMAESRGREQRESTRRDDELIIIGGFAVHFSSNGFPNTASPLEKEFLRGQPHQHGYRQRVRRRGCAIACDTKNGPLRALGLRRNRLGLRRNLSQKVSFRTMTKLPSPNQTWSHSTNSLGQLIEALKGDDDVTAIEADILMGRVLPFGGDKNKNNFNDDATACVGKDALVPIMSHPPHRTSDLSAKDFIHRILNSSVSRHMKLDFKEMDAVQPTLQHLHKFPDSTQTIFLNADILPGPGRYPSDIMVPADKFVSACLEFVQQSKVCVCCQIFLSLLLVLASPSLSHTHARNVSISLKNFAVAATMCVFVGI